MPSRLAIVARVNDIAAYNNSLEAAPGEIVAELLRLIQAGLPDAEGKVWHGHPVWFLEGNPIVGYSVKAGGVELLFWSGQSFSTPGLKAVGKFKAAGKSFTEAAGIDAQQIRAWLTESVVIQWDYANLPKKRSLEKLTSF